MRPDSQHGNQGQPSHAEPGKIRVLLVDDDLRLLTSLSRGLHLRGFDVVTADSPGEALPLLEDKTVHILILDVAMPGMDGISFCRLIRGRFGLPILMLTARDDVADRVAGLESGADDYLVKPFALDELVARIKALLRRVAGEEKQILTFQDLRLDRSMWVACRGTRELPLTASEFRILEQLMIQPGHVISRDHLLRVLWTEDAQPDTNVIDVHVKNLRRKLEAAGQPRLVHNVRGVGYKLQTK